MENVLHRGVTVGIATAVAGAGLFAVVPLTAPPTLPLRQTDVRLMSDPVTETLTTVWQDAQLAINDVFGTGGFFDDLFQLDLDGALYDLHSSLYNLVLIPENLLVGGLGALLGEDLNMLDFLWHSDHIVGSDLLGDLFFGFKTVLEQLGYAMDSLFNLDLAGSLYHSLQAFDYAFLEIPAALILDPVHFLWSDLLGMP